MALCHRLGEELLVTSNSTVYWKIRRIFVLSCAYCRPHRRENRDRWCKHGRNQRYKDVHKGSKSRMRTIRDLRFWEVA